MTFSNMPELVAKVKLFVALVPVANVSHVEGAFRGTMKRKRYGDNVVHHGNNSNYTSYIASHFIYLGFA